MQFTLTISRTLFTPCTNRIAGVLHQNGLQTPYIPPDAIDAIMADYLYTVYSRSVAPPDVVFLLSEHILRHGPVSVPSPVIYHIADQMAGPLAELNIRIQPLVSRVVEDLEMAGEEITELTLVMNASPQQILMVIDTDPIDEAWGAYQGNTLRLPQSSPDSSVVCGLL